MTALFQYSLAVSVPLLILWIAYRIIQYSNNTFGINRLLILCIYAFSLLLFPLITLFSGQDMTGGGVILGSEDAINKETVSVLNIGSWVWIAGMFVCILFTLTDVIRTIRLIKKTRKEYRDGHTICISDDCRVSPFSFFGYIVLNSEDYDKNKATVLLHEEGHMKLWHSVDMFIAQLFTIFCWYNPAAWMLRSDLKILHEYQADGYVLNHGTDRYEYQMFLVQKANGGHIPMIADGFSYTRLKKRIETMAGVEVPMRHRPLLLCLLFGAIAIATFVMTLPPVLQTLTPISKSSNTLHVQRIKLSSGQSSKPTLDDMNIYLDDQLIEHSQINEIPTSDIDHITVDKRVKAIYIDTRK